MLTWRGELCEPRVGSTGIKHQSGSDLVGPTGILPVDQERGSAVAGRGFRNCSDELP